MMIADFPEVTGVKGQTAAPESSFLWGFSTHVTLWSALLPGEAILCFSNLLSYLAFRNQLGLFDRNTCNVWVHKGLYAESNESEG